MCIYIYKHFHFGDWVVFQKAHPIVFRSCTEPTVWPVIIPIALDSHVTPVVLAHTCTHARTHAHEFVKFNIIKQNIVSLSTSWSVSNFLNIYLIIVYNIIYYSCLRTPPSFYLHVICKLNDHSRYCYRLPTCVCFFACFCFWFLNAFLACVRYMLVFYRFHVKHIPCAVMPRLNCF